MLQQTQVATVIPFYQKFLKRFPNPASLARAKEEVVLSHWAGLGYYRRAKLLHHGVQKVQKEFNGDLPHHPEELQKIPGIGRYTAGAIASMAFQYPAPLVDGNVIRVYSRVFRIQGHAKESVLQKKIWEIAQQLVDPKKPGDFNQALMELGATTCRTFVPACERCPVSKLCGAFNHGNPEAYPKAAPRQKTVSLHRAVALCLSDHHILLVKRHHSRWFDGLWELPHDYLEEKGEVEKNLQTFLKDQLGISLKNLRPVPTTTHAITHHRISSLAWLGEPHGSLKPQKYYQDAKFFPLKALPTTALPNLDRKVLVGAGLAAPAFGMVSATEL